MSTTTNTRRGLGMTQATNHRVNVGEGRPGPRRATTVQAAHADTVTLVPGPQVTAAAADTAARTIEGIVMPWNQVGHTSVGPLIVRAAAALRLPDELGRVKLMDYHQTPAVAIGVATAAEARPEGLWMSFRIGTTATADAALTEAAEGLRDGLSVELADVTYAPDDEVTDAALISVALVPIPAFEDARVASVAAAHATSTTPPTGRNNSMTPEQIARLAALRAQETLTQAEAAELAALAQLETDADQGDDTDQADADQGGGTATGTATPEVEAGRRQVGHARVPGGLPGSRTVQTHALPEMYAAMARVLTGRSRVEVEAALANITGTANIWTSPDAYAGELWSGLSYARRFVGMMATAPLTNYKVRGWRWVVKPEVGDYAGDKTAVPSNSPTTEDVEVMAARLAGAHDIDRKYADFGDTEFLASYYRAMTESYAVKSDLKARAALIAAANANVSATVAGSLLKALMTAKVELGNYEDDNFAAGEPDWYLVNSSDYIDLLDTTTAAAPAFLSDLGITPDKLTPTSAVPAGSVAAGVKGANTFYELGQAPIRVEAINISDGGIDGGVFGYWAHLNHHAKGTVRVNFGA